jgi:hypothetical protein
MAECREFLFSWSNRRNPTSAENISGSIILRESDAKDINHRSIYIRQRRFRGRSLLPAGIGQSLDVPIEVPDFRQYLYGDGDR